jgi:hypothetical protein
MRRHHVIDNVIFEGGTLHSKPVGHQTGKEDVSALKESMYSRWFKSFHRKQLSEPERKVALPSLSLAPACTSKKGLSRLRPGARRGRARNGLGLDSSFALATFESSGRRKIQAGCGGWCGGQSNGEIGICSNSSIYWSGRRASNPRPSAWKADALAN